MLIYGALRNVLGDKEKTEVATHMQRWKTNSWPHTDI